jgi:hypothetical protein
MSSFERLVRFKNPAGVTFYGEVELKETPTKETLVGASVTVYEGGDPWDDSFKLTKKREQITEVSHVLSRLFVGISILGVGTLGMLELVD